jgi:carboxymethylenebutenolidase
MGPSGYHARPADARRGGLVLLHDGWDVGAHIRALADLFAEAGFEVRAPYLFAGFDDEAAHPGADSAALDPFARAGWGLGCLPEVEAAIEALEGPVFALGFAFGGTVAWLAAGRCAGLAAVSSVSGGHVARWLDEGPRCPTILHFGKHDPMIPPADVQRISEAHPDLPVWLYDAGHGFCAPGPEHDANAAHLALLRTRQLFHRAGGKGEMGG